MGSLGFTGRKHLERILGMEGGYVLDFTDRTFGEFVHESIGVDPSDARYTAKGTSKANRLRRLWEVEPDENVSKLTEDLIAYGLTLGRITEDDAKTARALLARREDQQGVRTSQKSPLQFRGKLGDGAFADVYRAFDPQLEREVAVKIIKPEGAGATDALTQARALARVRHPNVGVVFSVENARHPDTLEEVPSVVMELIDGKHLDKVLEGAPLEIEAARRIGTGILDGLAAIHAEGLHHLDLHGENILVTDSVVKIIDIHYLTSLAVISSIPRQQRNRRDFTLLFSNLARLLKACGRNPRPVNDLQDGDVFDLAKARAAFKAALEAPVVTVEPPSAPDPVVRLKACLPEPNRQIELRDLLTEVADAACARLSSTSFSPEGSFNADVLVKRLADYEDASHGVVRVAAILGHWSTEERQQRELSRLLRRLCSNAIEQRAGNPALLDLRWLPFLRVMYAAGIGALCNDNYASLSAMFRCRVPGPHEKEWMAVEAFGATWSEIGAREYLKALPQHQRNFTPVSEYMFATIQKSIDVLRLGNDYERVFDRFEILLALVHADTQQGWGPVGRYGWKLRSRRKQATEWSALEEEAKAAGDGWGPLRAGLFGASHKRFEVTQKSLFDLVARLNWH